MFDFLKKFFKKDTETADVELSDLSRWFYEKTKDYTSELNDYVKERVLNLEGIKKELEEAIDGLKSAKIQDEDKIQPKVKNVVLAARQNYIRDLQHIMKEIRIDSSDKKAVVESCKLAQEGLDLFAKRTAKSYFTTQHLFHKPLDTIAGHLKDFGMVIKELNGHVKASKTFKAEAIKKSISKLNNDIELLGNWNDSLRNLNTKKEGLISNIKDSEKEIEDIKKTEEFIEYERDISKLESLKEELRIRGNSVFELIAPLQSAIKKYERLAMDNVEILKKYIEDTVKAFLEDEKNVLPDILGKVKDSIEKGSLGLKDKKKEKTVKQIDMITSEKLEDLKKQYKDTEKKITEVKDKINKNNIQDKQEELLKKKEKISRELEGVERDINEVLDMTSKIDIEKEKKEILSRINELLGIEVKLR